MAAAISPGTGRAYGVTRVCDGFGVPRSSFYAWRRQQEHTDPPPIPSRRGPTPAISDAGAERNPHRSRSFAWIGEGHRKVWARLRVLDGIRVARKRVLRLMRENGLLSPHRHLPRQDAAHDGRIITEAPNLMWGTDATQIPTVLDGKVWLFAVVDHWNAEAMGWHVAKIGNRYAAAQAVGMAIKTEFGAVAAGSHAVLYSVTTMAAHSWPTTSRTRSNSGAWLRASPSSASPKPTAWPNALPNLQGTGRPRPHLSDHRRRPRCRAEVLRTLQCRVAH